MREVRVGGLSRWKDRSGSGTDRVGTTSHLRQVASPLALFDRCFLGLVLISDLQMTIRFLVFFLHSRW